MPVRDLPFMLVNDADCHSTMSSLASSQSSMPQHYAALVRTPKLVPYT